MTNCYINLQYMIIHFKPTLRQIYVIEMRQISYCKKQTNKEKKNKKTKKTKENKTLFFFLPPQVKSFWTKNAWLARMLFLCYYIDLFRKIPCGKCSSIFHTTQHFFSVHAILLQNNPCFFLIACIASKF